MTLASSQPSITTIVDDLVDERVGIINSVVARPRDAGEPNFFHFWATASNASAFASQSNFPMGGGSAIDRDRALAKALGEAVERYCASIYDKAALPLACSSSA